MWVTFTSNRLSRSKPTGACSNFTAFCPSRPYQTITFTSGKPPLSFRGATTCAFMLLWHSHNTLGGCTFSFALDKRMTSINRNQYAVLVDKHECKNATSIYLSLAKCVE